MNMWIFWHVLLTDESEEEEEIREVTKEECELGVVHSWMEVGGVPALAEEEAQGLLFKLFLFAGYSVTLHLYFLVLYLSLTLVTDPMFFFF